MSRAPDVVRIVRCCVRAAHRVILVAAVLLAGPGAFADPSRAVSAMRPLKDYRELTIGILADQAESQVTLASGEPSGMSIDVLREIVGPAVSFEARTYATATALVEAACAGQVDIVANVARAADVNQCLTFTVPYAFNDTAVIARGTDAAALAQNGMRNAVVAVEDGHALGRIVRDRFPDAQIHAYPDRFAALRAVKHGSADLYLGTTLDAKRLLQSREFGQLTLVQTQQGELAESRFAVPSGRVDLRNDLNERLLKFDSARLAEIRSRWLDGSPDPLSSRVPLVLTDNERRYLHGLPPISLGFDSGSALAGRADTAGQPDSLDAAYVAYLSKALGVTFQTRGYSGWAATSRAFERGEVNMMIAPERDRGAPNGVIRTSPFASYPLVIVGRHTESVATSLADVPVRRIAISERLAANGRLDNLAPQAQLVVVPTLAAALDRMEKGEVDLVVDNLAAVDLALSPGSHDNLKILGPAGGIERIGFSLRPEIAGLAPVIDHALRAMSGQERQRIALGRHVVNTQPSSGWSVNALRLLPVLIGIGVVLAVTLRALVLLQREIRRRIETEWRLATQLSFQQTMMEVVPYPLVAKDLDNRYIAVNRAFEQTLGVRREDIVGRTALETQPWGQAHSEQLHALAAKSIASAQREQVELEYRNGLGETRRGLFWTGAFGGADGTMAGVVGTMIDITDIRNAEMRARENERRLHDVTRSLPAVVFQLRRSPEGLYSFPFIGGDTRPLFGVDLTTLGRDQLTGLSQIYHEDKRVIREVIERSAMTLEPVHTEFRSTVDNGRRWVRSDLVARREDDGSVVWSGYWADASVEHTRADELARARDAAEAASRAKDDFLAMMSHEIRTPMNGVLGLVEVFETTPLNADQSQMLGMIQDSASALLQILDDLLDFSKIEAGRLTIESMPIDLRELVDNAVGLLAGRAHEKGLRMRVDIASEVAASLRGDSVRLRQVLFNLLSNAIKFTPTGQVSLSVGIVVSCDGEQTIELCVADTGIGIAPEAQASLFEPFVQAESSTTRRFGGTGLGLTICNKLVELMDGTLHVQSAVGHGTRMTVRLTMPVECLHYPADALRGKRGIVAVDDAAVARALMDFGQTLGLVLGVLPRDAAALRQPETFDDIDLVFLSEAQIEALPIKSRVIHVTEKPKPTGYRILDNDIRVSANPISWRGLGAACMVALTGLPQRVSLTTGRIEASVTPPDRDRALKSGRLVLVAEDHPVNQELIRQQLSLCGFACDVVQDGVEALAALHEASYGFLITDCHMPNMTGYELARRVRELERGSATRLPILGITASTAPEELTMCREAGMDDCLVKPTRLATLRDHLNRWKPSEATHGKTSAERPPEGESHVAAPCASEDDVDLTYMTQLWGSEATVKALLDSFVSSFRDDLVALVPILEGGTVQQMREWHHRVTGAASVLRYQPLLAALEAFRTDLMDKSDGQRRKEGRELIARCGAMLEHIESRSAAMA